jgi:hypothetical protein
MCHTLIKESGWADWFSEKEKVRSKQLGVSIGKTTVLQGDVVR